MGVRSIIDRLNVENVQEVNSRESQIQALQEAYGDCRKRLDNLLALKISPQNTKGDLLSDVEYTDRKRELMEEKQRLEARLNLMGERVNEWIDVAEQTFNFARNARHWFEYGAPEDRRAIVRALGLNLSLKDKILRVDAPSPFLLIQEAAEKEPSILARFEPAKTAIKQSGKANLEVVWDRSPTLSGG